jgi:hypothetical protein
MVDVLSGLVAALPVGTNLGVLHALWAIVSGRLLAARGALVPALAACGLCAADVRRSWRAVAHGRWSCEQLVCALQEWIAQEQWWQAHEHGGYRPVACDITAFFRPALRNCRTKHYCSHSKRPLAAVPFGLLVRVGAVGKQRVPVPLAIVRADVNQKHETELMQRVLETAKRVLTPGEVLVADRGFRVPLLQGAGIAQYVVRCQKNFAPLRADVPPSQGRGRKRKWGDVVRPVARAPKGKLLAATLPDAEECWEENAGTVRALIWERLTTKQSPPGAHPFRCIAIHDPRYREPLLLATTLPITARAARDLYVDRWPVEMVPQTAKQMLGAQRHFVFGDESRQRLPELALCTACIQLYTAATQAPIPTGFWDRTPQPTSGRYRRALAQADFPQLHTLPQRIRKKNSVTQHLPKGVQAHRRQPSGFLRPNQPHNRKHKTALSGK